MTLSMDNMSNQIKQLKQQLKHDLPDYQKAYTAVSEALEKEVERIQEEEKKGHSVPVYSFQEVERGFSDQQRQKIQQAGCVVIRGTLPKEEAVQHNQELERYIIDNGYYDHTPKVEDNYFSQLKSDKPQIFGLYWSKAQIWARQHQNMATLRSHLNRLWDFEHDGVKQFNPDLEVSYADRVRRRSPGDTSLGLSPHVDSGSIERWLEPNYRSVYRHVFTGHWQDYQAFDARHRIDVEEFNSSAVCSVFRTFQGWVALTPQGAGDGTLQLIPSTLSMPYMLLRALQDDVADDDLCGAQPGRALTVNKQWHELLLKGLVSIPKMEPGDTVWWHPDTVHAVEDKHSGEGYSNVMFIGSAPDCDKNRQFLPKQKSAFLEGRSCPDFAPEDHEVTYTNRATENDLTALGKRQMGL
ncbi:YbiU family protein [Vibrio nigripulchritudo]|uniref:YbiU family protein n=1 Tax=Vibrio nigripulchritudo TaxID=28173 RepID=UPI002492725C|nr:YbiU family protein [Vibrio nigripulchritudo]BDU38592.1 diguanylate cyclase [Vibrio nigripulchritudo]BDU44314.1 diguanylate cyclase [Vibrio nigripulchritudo]